MQVAFSDCIISSLFLGADDAITPKAIEIVVNASPTIATRDTDMDAVTVTKVVGNNFRPTRNVTVTKKYSRQPPFPRR